MCVKKMQHRKNSEYTFPVALSLFNLVSKIRGITAKWLEVEKEITDND